MLHESVTKGRDRRRTPRFPLPIAGVTGDLARARLVNVSRQGLAIEVPVESPLSRGERRRLTLHDSRSSVEVSGRIRWVRCNWREEAVPGDVQYMRVAGMAFEHILTPNPSGIWQSLQVAESGGVWGDSARRVDETPIQVAPRGERSTRTLSVTMPEPPRLLTPIDGATVDVSSLEVTCSVSMPEEIVSVRLNGREAEVRGERATASVILEPGPNRLTALIWRHSGLYRSFALGQVTRKES